MTTCNRKKMARKPRKEASASDDGISFKRPFDARRGHILPLVARGCLVGGLLLYCMNKCNCTTHSNTYDLKIKLLRTFMLFSVPLSKSPGFCFAPFLSADPPTAQKSLLSGFFPERKAFLSPLSDLWSSCISSLLSFFLRGRLHYSKYRNQVMYDTLQFDHF